ncbi:M15 family metallopeptidase [Methylovulum psychrotolerans]|uniref:Peptidase M15 n=1 Tax=Methylovulum psychrotolerans TaxID=1704499 RepID=A0A1Z4C0G5_9GAMM|nr:M15 family metallopeptidase [Methylovulum psychrotolerans]ASF47012.1 peptidase M15 [Methylovulum psychrotolerans]
MIESRKLEDLTPETEKRCRAFIEKCRGAGIDIIITSTYRDKEKQDALYAQGRNGNPGKIVTNASGGKSFHNYGVAFDFVPIVHGKAQYTDIATFKRCGAIAKSVGLEWAGDWKTFKEYAHCQFTNGLTLRDLQAGKKPI